MTTRKIKWIRGTKGGETPLRWGQQKSVPHPVKDKVLTTDTDRQIDYAPFKPNPSFVPLDKRTPGQKLSDEQRLEKVRQFKHPKATRDEMQDRVEEVIALVEKIASGKVQSVFYSAEAGECTYVEEFTLEGGEKITETERTDDETIIAACHDLVTLLADAVSTNDKPVVVAEPLIDSRFFSLSEPIEPE